MELGREREMCWFLFCVDINYFPKEGPHKYSQLTLLISYRISQTSLLKYSKVNFSHRQCSPGRANSQLNIFLFEPRSSEKNL